MIVAGNGVMLESSQCPLASGMCGLRGEGGGLNHCTTTRHETQSFTKHLLYPLDPGEDSLKVIVKVSPVSRDLWLDDSYFMQP